MNVKNIKKEKKINMRFMYMIMVLMLLFSCEKETLGDKDDKDPEQQGSPHGLGLQVNTDGVVTLNGHEYKGVGVNYFDAFYRNIKDASDVSYEEGFRQLKENNIPYLRFMAGAYWPSEWSLYLNNKVEYFKRLDRFVKSAEDEGIGLIPSLFWTHHTFPDLVKEPVNQWGNTNSKTIEFMNTYIEEVVTRYVSSPAIWGWEFGNEYNLHIDLVGINIDLPTWENLGCPATRTEADKLSSTDLTIAINEFSNTIRKYDVSRIIFSGNSIPRDCAYHLKKDQKWEADNINQYTMSLESQNSGLLNSFTLHLYPENNSKRFADLPDASIKDIIRISKEYSDIKKKPLFIGEFGAPVSMDIDEQAVFMEMLEGIEMYKVPLSCVWVFDLPSQNSDWNITFMNARKYMLGEIGKLNDRL